jgi:two-component system sensor histidine kinase KdpD
MPVTKAEEPPRLDHASAPTGRAWLPGWILLFPWHGYLWGSGLILIATVLGKLIYSFISPTNLEVVYLLGVVFAAIYLGRGPAILASFLSVLAFDFFFVPPYYTLAVSDTQYLITFFGLLAVGLVISNLTAQVREQAEASQRREAQTAALYELGRDLTIVVGLEAVTQAIIFQIGKVFSREVAIFLPEGPDLKVFAASPGLTITPVEMGAAAWAFEHGLPAGRATENMAFAEIRCQPLKTTHGVIGVLGVKPFNPQNYLTSDQRRLLDAFANQVALAIERARLLEQARQAELLKATEQLQTALLNSISHDLRTPLVSITGALSSLQEDNQLLDEETRGSLVETARDEADRLNRLVGNLLDMTRLEAGAMHIHHEVCDLQDLVGSALAQFGTRLVDRPVQVIVPEDLPLVPLDFVLIGQVLFNVLDNAFKYSPPGSPVEISVQAAGAYAEITVADRGIGIPPEDLQRVFDKFYRVQRPGSVNGTGLGLSISRGILEAHGGTIRAENRPGGGTAIRLQLPLSMSALAGSLPA